MARSLAIILVMAFAGIGISLPFLAEQARAQQFPASAVIRGENIRLRAEPAEVTDDIAILQRGDEITITGEVTAADGLLFYPVEVVQTGDAGWVRDLFINPKSMVPLQEPAPELAPEPAPDANAAEDENGRRERPARQNRRNNREAADQEAAAEAAPAAEGEALPAETPAPEAEQPAEAPAETEALIFSGTGAATPEPVALQPGRYRATATMEVSEASGFVCNLNGPENFTETLFDEQIDSAQSWTARVSVAIETAGDYVIECSNTNDPWTIEFALRQ